MKIAKKVPQMSIHPAAVYVAKKAWHWQWSQLMQGLAPADSNGNYKRPKSQKLNALVPLKEDILNRSSAQLPTLIIGRSCPWAHRTWLVCKLRELEDYLHLNVAIPNRDKGLWEISPKFLGCNSLIQIYKICNCPPDHRATVPALIDPGNASNKTPQLLGNESAQLVETLNLWPTMKTNSPNFAPENLKEEINQWQKIIQPYVNDGVYRCGFARNQSAYNKASKELFNALLKIEKSLSKKGPWLCGEQMTIADIRLFPTLIRWESIYSPLFGCSQEPLWSFPNLWNWRKKFFAIPKISETCDSDAWRNDYFGALFPLRPSNIVPNAPNLIKIVNQ